MLVYLNDRLVPEGEAKISVFDHGFLYGDGVFETLRAYGGRIFRVDAHLERLFRSAQMIGLRVPYSPDELKKHLYTALEANHLKEARLRLTLSRGPGDLGLDPDLCEDSTRVIMAKEFHGYPEELYQQGARIALIQNPQRFGPTVDPRVKSTSLLATILAQHQAKQAGALEGVLVNRDGFLTEGTTSNLFLVQAHPEGMSLLTPCVQAGILEGITRQVVIELAQELGISVKEGFMTSEDLFRAEEGFLTSTTREVMPITQVGFKPLGSGKPGVVTQQLSSAYRDRIRKELL